MPVAIPTVDSRSEPHAMWAGGRATVAVDPGAGTGPAPEVTVAERPGVDVFVVEWQLSDHPDDG